MLHSLPAVLDELERCLIAGEDPMPLLTSIRWSELIDWPRNEREAGLLKQRLASLGELVQGLQAPLKAALMGFHQGASYENGGGIKAPTSISLRLHQSV